MSKRKLKKLLADLEDILNTKPPVLKKRPIKYKAAPKYKKASINFKSKR